MSQPKKITTAILVIVIVGLGVSHFFNESKKSIEPVTVGAILPLSGELSLFGQWLKEGIELSAQNNDVEILFEDNQNKTSQAISAFQKLNTIDNVSGIITGRTPVAYALTPLSQQHDLPIVLTFADLPERSVTGQKEEAAKCVLNYHFPVKDEIKLIAEQISQLGSNSIVLTVNDEFGNLSTKLFRDYYNGELLFEERFDPGETDFRSIIHKMPPDADFIFLLAYEQNFVNLVKQLNEQNINIPIVAPNVLTVYLHLVQSYLKQPIYVTMSLYDAGVVNDGDLYIQFKKDFTNQFGREPNMVNAESYEAANFLINTLLKENAMNENICSFLTDEKTIHSIFGNLKIDSDGQVHFPLALVKMLDGQKEVISVWNP